MKRIQKHDLILVSLNRGQIETAKSVNGKRKNITHALLCGPYGQILGTEKQCLKYYAVWLEIFPLLFARRKRVKRAKISDYKSTSELVTELIHAQDYLANHYGIRLDPPKWRKSSGCLVPFRRKR